MAELDVVRFGGIECGGFCAAMSLRKRGVTGWVILIAALGVGMLVLGWSQEDLMHIHFGLMIIGAGLVKVLEVRLKQKIDDLQERLNRMASQLRRARTPAERISAGSRDLSDIYSNDATVRR